MLRGIEFIRIDDDLLEHAALLDPTGLRSLDAIHLAVARSLVADLETVVTYDVRTVKPPTRSASSWPLQAEG